MLYWCGNYHLRVERGYSIRLLVGMKLILNLVEMSEIDFEFIFDHSSLIWLSLTAIYFIVAYSDFVIFNFYKYYFL